MDIVLISLNTHALVATSLRDELVNTFNICTSNCDDYLKELTDDDVALIEQIRKKQTKGEEPWFPLTRKYLAKLVYNVSLFILFIFKCIMLTSIKIYYFYNRYK